MKKRPLTLCAAILAITACSSNDNNNVGPQNAKPQIDQFAFAGTTEEQANNCNAIAATAPDKTNVKYVG